MKKQVEVPKRQKKVFDDSESSLVTLPSTWHMDAKSIQRVHASCQTPDSLFQLQEREIQSGRYTKVVQLQVKEQEKGTTLVDYIAEKRPEYKTEEWDTKIKDGCVTVDCEVNTDPIATLDTDYFIEYVESKVNKSIQTESRFVTRDLNQSLDDQRVASFLDRIFPFVDATLTANETSRALDTLDYNTNSSLLDEQGDRILYWKQLWVDLEKKKILYPDWNRAKYVTGNIIQCSVTRNKERIYDIEYDDGAVLYGVKEDYIRLLDDPNDATKTGGRGNYRTSSSKRNASGRGGSGSTLVGVHLASRLQEGVRVHARVMQRNGQVKYLPGLVVKVGKNLYDIDCEGNRLESGLAVADLCIGLSEGQHVEARKPSKTWLHATGVSWNATGSGVAVSYGRLDITGWCDFPGALSVWNVFNTRRDSNNMKINPDFVLDHASCLMSVAWHPLIPSVLVAGSFNGEIVLWDLTQSENTPVYTSPIIEYAHKDAVVQVQWVYIQGEATSLTSWQVLSLGADGRVLFWSTSNKLQHPVRGFLMTKSRSKSSSSSSSTASSRRMFPVSHGASAAAISTLSSASSSASSTSATPSMMTKPTWLVIGQEGGTLLRVQFARLLNTSTGSGNNVTITADVLRALPPVEEVFPSLKALSQSTTSSTSTTTSTSSFHVQGHVGSVTAIDWSPFHKNLYLTAGSDGVVKLFHTLQPLPLFKIEPAASIPYNNSNNPNNDANNNNNNRSSNTRKSNKLTSHDTVAGNIGLVAVTAVKFSPIRPAVFAVALSDGRVFLYDLYHSDLFYNTGPNSTSNNIHVHNNNNCNSTAVLPTQVLYVTSSMFIDDTGAGVTTAGDIPSNSTSTQHNNANSNGTIDAICVTALAFNHKHRDVLCAVDWLGRVHLWRLSSRLCARKRDELVRWEKIGRNQQNARDELELDTAAVKNESKGEVN